MLENLMSFFKRMGKKEELLPSSSDAAKERLHLVLMQDRANVSIDFLDLMKQEIIDVIKKYIDIDENSMDVRFTNQINEDGTNGAPALYANIPIVAIKNDNNIETVQHENENDKSKNNDKKLEDGNNKNITDSAQEPEKKTTVKKTKTTNKRTKTVEKSKLEEKTKTVEKNKKTEKKDENDKAKTTEKNKKKETQ